LSGFDLGNPEKNRQEAVGVHSPEFESEKNIDSAKGALILQWQMEWSYVSLVYKYSD
jgi:hypothetical protein